MCPPSDSPSDPASDPASDAGAPSYPTLVLAVPGGDGKTFPYLFRLGSQDLSIEGSIAADENSITDKDSEWNKQGVLLYAADTISLIAPEIKQVVQSSTEWSSDRLEVNTTEAGLVQTAELKMSGASAGYTAAANVEFQDGIGAEFITGVEAKVVTGLGITATQGMEFKAVTGMETTVVDGWSVECKNGAMEASSPFTSVRLDKEFIQKCAGDVVLGAGATTSAAAGTMSFRIMIAALRTINGLAGLTSLITGAVTGGRMDESGSVDARSARIRSMLQDQYDVGTSIVAAYFAAQVLSIVANYRVVDKTVGGNAASELELTPDSATLKVGPLSEVAIAQIPNDPSVAARLAALQGQLTAAQATQAAANAAFAGFGDGTNFVLVTEGMTQARDASDAANQAVADANQAVAAAQAIAANNPLIGVTDQGGYLSLEATHSIILKAGASTISLSAAGVTIEAPEIAFSAQSAVTTSTPIKSFS